MFEKIKNFFSEVGQETKRITWPERRELVDSTLVVVFFIILLAVILLVCDKVISTGLSLLLG